MKKITIKSIDYVTFSMVLLHSQIIYAENAPIYFIGLQANQSEQTTAQATPFVYICAPMDTTVPPSYICAPTSVPMVTINQPEQFQKVYPQTLKTSDIYSYNPYIQQHSQQYRHFGANTSLSNYYLPQYRPYEIDSNQDYNNSSSILHQNISTQPSLDSWSPTSNFSTSQSQVLPQNRQFSPVYPQNPYANNIKNNAWQKMPQYRPDKNIPSELSNPFFSQPLYK